MRNWIDLFEFKLFRSTERTGPNGRPLPIYENPSLSNLEALAQRHDLRGVTDGINLFVADANYFVHSEIANAAIADMRWQGERAARLDLSSCYIYDDDLAHNAKYKNEWYGASAERDHGVKTYQVSRRLRIAVYNEKPFTALLRDAERFYFIPPPKPRVPTPEEDDELLRKLGVLDDLLNGKEDT